MKTRAFLVCLLLLGVLWGMSCIRNKNPCSVENGNGEPIPETCPQTDIPWPSLADSPWPMYLHDPQHTSRSPYVGPQEGTYSILGVTGWEIFSSPAITADGNIVVGADGVYSFSPAGDSLWYFDPGGTMPWDKAVESSPLIASDGTIYVGCNDKKLYALRSDGTLKRSFAAGGFGYRSPVISSDGQVVYLSVWTYTNRTLFAVDTTGQMLWRYDLNSNELGYTSPALSPDGSTIYVSNGGVLHAVDTDGSLKWQFAATGTSRTPVVDSQGNIYCYAGDFLYAVNPSGTLRWRFEARTDSRAAPCIGYDGTIYTTGVCAEGITLYALDYGGRIKWETIMPGARSALSPPSVDAEGNVYLCFNSDPFVETPTNFIAVDREGQIKYTLHMQNSEGFYQDVNTSPVIGETGVIYTGSDAFAPCCIFRIQ